MTTNPGLEGVVAAETVLSGIDGAAGRLTIRGHDVEALAAASGFEQVCELLWEGTLGGGREQLGEARARAFDRWPALGCGRDLPDPMSALRGAVAQFAPSPDLDPRDALVGAVAVFTAAAARRRAGRDPIPPDAALGHAEDYLRMLGDADPDSRVVRALDVYLVTVADHGMNASTFTARVVASTDSDPVSAVTAALGALKGPLHGGAPGPVLDMLRAIGSADRAAEWISAELEAGRRIMGMGHRVYRVRDPRAAVLEQQIERLERAGISSARLSLARSVEKTAADLLRLRHPERPIAANVEFYTAVLLDALGIAPELFTPTFACARTAGWLAHFAEQRATGRLIRPSSVYVGPLPRPAGVESDQKQRTDEQQ